MDKNELRIERWSPDNAVKVTHIPTDLSVMINRHDTKQANEQEALEVLERLVHGRK